MEGHELHEEDIRLMHTFDQARGGTTQFEAHADAQVVLCSLKNCCVLIDWLIGVFETRSSSSLWPWTHRVAENVLELLPPPLGSMEIAGLSHHLQLSKIFFANR